MSAEASSEAARREILERVQRVNGGAAARDEAFGAWDQISRDYDAAPQPRESVLALFIKRLRDYDAEVERLPRAAIAAKVREVVEARRAPAMLVPSGIATDLLPQDSSFVMDSGFSPTELDTFAGVITEATLGIAETGTLVLQNVPGQGRRAASLVPDFHLCILRVEDLVASVPEAIDRLQNTAYLPTTFISGPSATADIEMTRIKGVHGPRFLHVLLAE